MGTRLGSAVYLLDANVLIAAFRPDHADHARLKAWLEKVLRSGTEVTFPTLVEIAFLRIVTHPGIFRLPSTLGEATGFLRALRGSGLCREIQGSAAAPRLRERWWSWCEELGLAGNDLNDAYLAATAIELRCTLVSRDQGFARFRGLDWLDPAPRH